MIPSKKSAFLARKQAKNSRRLSRAGGLEIDYDKQENKIIPRPFDEDSAKVLHYNRLPDCCSHSALRAHEFRSSLMVLCSS